MTEYNLVFTAIQTAETQLGNLTQRYSELRLSEKPCHYLENDDIVAFIEMSQRAVDEMCIECNEKLSTLVSRLEKRTKMMDPVTKAPRFGPRMLEKVNALIRRFDAWKLELETSDVLRDIKSMGLCLRERKLCKLKEKVEQSRLSKVEEVRREHELLQMVREDEEEHRRRRIVKDEIERQNLTMLARQAQAIREAKARKLEEDALRSDEELQKLNAQKEAVVLGKEGLRQALLTLERNVDDKALYRSKLDKVHKIVSNICSEPEKELYRKIDKDNYRFQEDFGKFEGGYHFLLSMGFKEVYDEIESKTMFYLEEPDVNEDMDAWTDWFDSMKDYKTFLEDCMSGSPPA
uniref:Uncharacterized protein AlNc14C87G5567 n=1 Tax=Albugo laibachii Nc14 TaxID=890382 RepID=F0WG38_9STRA|nr:conserved hypothetical protein [Albugo laibachii Nc14]|eukprot:CCA20172.1 conserved hypothetical protein [Albugo laibachii Nc14]